MKKSLVLLAMILWAFISCAVLVYGASFRNQSDQVQQPTTSQSDKESANSSLDIGKDTQARGPTRGTPEHRRYASHAKPAPIRQPRSGRIPAARDLQTEALQNVPDSHETRPTLFSGVPGSSNVLGKTVRHSGMPLPPSTVALNGQQFKNSRDPGARMASTGGSANSARGTGAINGSDIKRKP
jgi:hypothetical protein